jgi:hypothetical protein
VALIVQKYIVPFQGAGVLDYRSNGLLSGLSDLWFIV